MTLPGPKNQKQIMVKSEAEAAPRLIEAEPSWLTLPSSPHAESTAGRIRLAQWATNALPDTGEFTALHPEDMYTVSYNLLPSKMNLTSDRLTLVQSMLPARRVLLHPPRAARCRNLYGSDLHCLRVYIPRGLFGECYETVYKKPIADDEELFDPHYDNDRVLAELVRVFVGIDEKGGAYGPTFVDAVGLAIAARIISLSQTKRAPTKTTRTPLAKWRLKRALEYLEAHLYEPIYLADLSAAAGLSRMHFAAQFRAAIGYAPHAYILRRRIEDAQRLLLEQTRTIADVALEMGFSSQSHFTVAFKSIVGTSPGEWRSSAAISRQRRIFT